MNAWLIVVIVICSLLVFFGLTHYLVVYLIFHKFFTRQPNERIIEIGYKNLSEEQDENLKNTIQELESFPHHEVSIQSKDNKKLVGDYYPASSDKLFILFHGFQSNSYMNLSLQALHFLKKGFNILLVDQRSHHRSEGKYITYGFYEHEDVLSWVEYADKLEGINEVILHGISMGGTSIALASEYITSNKVKHLVIEDAYTNLEKLADDIAETQKIPFYIFKKELGFCIRHIAKADWRKIDTSESLKENKIHSIFIRSEKDAIVNESFFNDNYNNCGCLKDKFIVPNAKHAWGAITSTEIYFKQLDKFLGE